MLSLNTLQKLVVPPFASPTLHYDAGLVSLLSALVIAVNIYGLKYEAGMCVFQLYQSIYA